MSTCPLLIDHILDALGELEGSYNSQQFDSCIICGDFGRKCRLVSFLPCFMSKSSLGLVACDLAFHDAYL